MALLLAACQSDRPLAPPPIAKVIRDPNPAIRTEALQRALQSGDTADVSELIEMLDDEDPSVRLLASASLTRITGRKSGYLPFAPEEARRAQRDEWRTWWATRQGTSTAPATQIAPTIR